MDSRMLAAFTDELAEMTKEAVSPAQVESMGSAIKGYVMRAPGKLLHGAKELLGHPSEIVPRLLHPDKGIAEGWHMYSPVAQIAKRAKEMNLGNPQAAAKRLGMKNPKVKEMLGSGLTGARHSAMLDPSVSLKDAWRKGGLKGTAEELSRRGWTGETKYTKYLPVGGKSWIPGYSALTLPGIINAPPPSKSGEGARGERIGGEIGSMAGMALTGGLGVLPGTIGWMIANKAGGRAGRVLDRLRAGASVGEAVHAPSPTEAAAQLSEIQKTYG